MSDKCFECGFPTREKWIVVPGGRQLPLCRKCQWKIPKRLNPFQVILSEESPKGRSNYKMTPEIEERAVELRRSGLTYDEISERLGVSAASVFKVCRGKF